MQCIHQLQPSTPSLARGLTPLWRSSQYILQLQPTGQSIDRNLAYTITTDRSEPGSNGNEGLLFIPWISSTTGASVSDCRVSITGHSYWGGCLPICWDAVGVSSNPSQLCLISVSHSAGDTLSAFLSPRQVEFLIDLKDKKNLGTNRITVYLSLSVKDQSIDIFQGGHEFFSKYHKYLNGFTDFGVELHVIIDRWQMRSHT